MRALDRTTAPATPALSRAFWLCALLFVGVIAFLTGLGLQLLKPANSAAEMLEAGARFVRTGHILPSRVVFRPRTPGPPGEFTTVAGRTYLPGWRAVAGYAPRENDFAAWLYDGSGHIAHR